MRQGHPGRPIRCSRQRADRANYSTFGVKLASGGRALSQYDVERCPIGRPLLCHCGIAHPVTYGILAMDVPASRTMNWSANSWSQEVIKEFSLGRSEVLSERRAVMSSASATSSAVASLGCPK